MIDLTLPDGQQHHFDVLPTGFDIVALQSEQGRDALAISVDGDPRDLARAIEIPSAKLTFITREDALGLEILRHDCAHIHAQAVQELYPGTQITIGPAIADGFYYDFASEHVFTPDDFPLIEARMREIIDRNEPIRRETIARAAAIDLFRKIGETYKAELIDAIADGDVITIYHQGSWFDLCRGPHLSSTGHCRVAFKLMKIAGAYWRGDSRNPMLQRIYGACFRSEDELAAYLHRLEEAERRDHRRLGKIMGWYHFQEEAPGDVFWHDPGRRLIESLIAYIRRRQTKAGYEEVATPQLLDRSLWERSGHWDKFAAAMMTVRTEDDRLFALKPMNCPGHVQIFRSTLRSYRELPLRVAEFGRVHRYEPSGALHGLLRVRAFTQDDAHVFCTPEQITAESVAMSDLILSIYRDFGFDDVRVKFSDRPEQRVGDDEVWDQAEAALRIAVDASGVPYEVNPGEGAFYGPKLEYVLRDAIGRDWQCGTIQVDFNLPGRLGATYIATDGSKTVPVMLHRAMMGSLERFAGILIEHYDGVLPLWLNPTPVVIATITDAAKSYADEIAGLLRAATVPVTLDTRNETISYKLREHSQMRRPLIWIVGAREQENRRVAIRRLGSRRQDSATLDEAMAALLEETQPPDIKRKP